MITPHSTIAIDPGVKLGCAFVLADDGGEIIRCGFTHDCIPNAASVAIVERPDYQGQRSDGARIQDLLALAWAGAKVAYGSAPQVVEVTPREWKGSRHKPSHHADIWSRFTRKEKVLFGGEATYRVIQTALEKGALDRWKRPGGSYYPAAFIKHNILDAAGLSHHYHGR